MNLELRLQTANLDDVIRYFIEGFDIKINSYEYFVDTSKKTVVFKLLIDKSIESKAKKD